MKNFNKKQVSKVVLGGMSALLIAGGLPYAVLAAQEPANKPMKSRYTADLIQLNNSDVTGLAELNMKTKANQAPSFKVKLSATGTTPGKTHPVHIHGKLTKEVAVCPTTSGGDANEDGFLSVIEGGPSYGPIKANLTSPQTPFGPSPTPLLFAPFAGTADNDNFPKSDADGNVSLNQTYKFDSSEAAQEAMESILPLEDQVIVVHGAMAPASVDADAFAALGTPVTGSLDETIYDVLLPVACGDISKVSTDEVTTPAPTVPAPVTPAPIMPDPGVSEDSTTAVSDFQARISQLEADFDAAVLSAQTKFETDKFINMGEARDRFIGTSQSARDRYINQFYEARNLLVDQLNRAGATELRNEVTAEAEQKIGVFSENFEITKKEFVENPTD